MWNKIVTFQNINCLALVNTKLKTAIKKKNMFNYISLAFLNGPLFQIARRLQLLPRSNHSKSYSYYHDAVSYTHLTLPTNREV